MVALKAVDTEVMEVVGLDMAEIVAVAEGMGTGEVVVVATVEEEAAGADTAVIEETVAVVTKVTVEVVTKETVADAGAAGEAAVVVEAAEKVIGVALIKAAGI